MPGMTILPQFQGDYYHLQNQQALAQALMQQSFQPQNTQAVGSGQYSIVPKYSAVGGLAQLGQALIAAKMQNQVAQGYQALGQNQWSALTGSPPAQQSAPQQAATDDNSSGPGVTSSPVPTPGQPTPQAYASALGSTAPTQAAPAASGGGGMLAPGSALNPSGMDSGKAAYLYMTMGPAEYAKNFVAPYVKPTEATLMANQAHVDPVAANAGALFKANNVAPYQFAPNTVVQDPRTGASSTTPAAAPAGSQNILGADNKWYTVPVQGGTAAIQAEAAAKTGGEGSMLPYDKGVDAAGNPLPVMSRTAAATQQAGATTPASAAIVQTESNGSPSAVSPKGAMGAWQVMPNTNANPGFGVKPAQNNSPAELNRVGQDYYNAMTQRYQSPTLGAIAYNMGPGATDQWIKNGAKFESLPAETRNYVGKVATLTALNSGAGQSAASPAAGGAVYAAPPMGAQVNAEKSAGNLQDELSKKFTTLSAANSEAQNTTSYLQNIKDLAARAAVGPQSDRLNYVNGLLSLAGSEKATDAVTANDLLNKYSGQITARLSANGMGTDAARSILQSAYPSAHMNKDAINEAADNLIGAQQMTQAKSRLLTPLANARKPTDYNNAEMKFDQNADPRIFQYANIQDPTQRQAFAQKLIKQDPKIVQKIRTLETMGALQ
jgi:soluble lytic murein transglycosylase-like protein